MRCFVVCVHSWTPGALGGALRPPKYQQQEPPRAVHEAMFLHCCCLLKDGYLEVRFRVWCYSEAVSKFALDLNDANTKILEWCGIYIVEVMDVRGTWKAFTENLS